MTVASGWLPVVAVASGSAVGALLRWQAGLWLNAPAMRWLGFPLGTLIVNGVGGLLIGVAMVHFERSPDELWRLLVITGLLGGLTTFSSFSAESLMLLQRGAWLMALAHTVAHVIGSLLCAALGFGLARLLTD